MTWLNGFLLVVALWFLASHFDWIDNTLLASPIETYNAIKKSFDPDASLSEKLFKHAGQTIPIALKGWAISLYLGTVLGLIFGFTQYLLRSFEVAIEFFRAIPPILAFPLMAVTFDYGDPAYVWTIVFGCLPIMMLTVSKGVDFISDQSLEILKVFNVGPIKTVIAKSFEMLPSIFLGARVTLSFALIISVVCEMVLTPKSGLALGSLAKEAEMSFETPVFYGILVLLGLFGFISNLLLKKLEKLIGVKQIDG